MESNNTRGCSCWKRGAIVLMYHHLFNNRFISYCHFNEIDTGRQFCSVDFHRFFITIHFPNLYTQSIKDFYRVRLYYLKLFLLISSLFFIDKNFHYTLYVNRFYKFHTLFFYLFYNNKPHRGQIFHHW